MIINFFIDNYLYKIAKLNFNWAGANNISNKQIIQKEKILTEIKLRNI